MLKLKMSVTAFVLLAIAIVVADAQFCNYLQDPPPATCKDPFTKCAPFNSAPLGQPANWVCPATYTLTQAVTPPCITGNCKTYCWSNGTTLCYQVRNCIRKPNVNPIECVDNGTMNAPHNTTYYYGDYCYYVCGD